MKTVETERALLIKEIQEVDDLSLLLAIKAVLHYGMRNEGRISLEQYNQELEEAEERVNAGKFIVHEEAVTRIGKWRNPED